MVGKHVSKQKNADGDNGYRRPQVYLLGPATDETGCAGLTLITCAPDGNSFSSQVPGIKAIGKSQVALSTTPWPLSNEQTADQLHPMKLPMYPITGTRLRSSAAAGRSWSGSTSSGRWSRSHLSAVVIIAARLAASMDLLFRIMSTGGGRYLGGRLDASELGSKE